jgi:hypothetical protein
MFRRLSQLLLVLVVVAGLSGFGIVHAPAAHAAGGACGNWFDNPGTVYGPRDYHSASWSVFDLGVGSNVNVNVDLEDYQYTDPSSGRCFVAYRASSWGPYSNSDGYYVYLRWWVCGHQEPDQQIGTAQASGEQVTTQSWDGFSAGNGAAFIYVPQVSTGMLFVDTSGCGFHSDNYYTNASSRNWSAHPVAQTGSIWYLHY